MKTKTIKKGPLLDALAPLYPDSSKTTLRSWIEQGRVRVNGTPALKSNTPVEEGMMIEVLKKPQFLKEGIKVIYEDQYLAAIEKPEGLLSVRAPFENKKTLHQFLKNKYGDVKVVHRLDQGTSGVILFAFDEETLKRLKKTFKQHDLKRQYIAIVEGKLNGKGKWVHYLKEDAAYKVHASMNPAEGEEAITHFESLSFKRGYTLVLFTLETGKKNQIRVQSSEMGHPLAGDSKYGAKSDPIKRLALHAANLELTHPITKKKLKLYSEPPLSFKQFIPYDKQI